MKMTGIAFDNTYARDLVGFYVPCQPEPAPDPTLVYFNHELADELALGLDDLEPPALAELFSGNRLPEGATPIAQAYAGHQFGQFSPQLGDGRALLIGEVIDRLNRRRDIAFKGSGKTPFSRRGDGKAAIGPMLREVLIGEAMHALGIPTTRALAVVATGERVYRDRSLPGATLTRIADSHLRVGTFQFFATHGSIEQLTTLAEYTIARHDPELVGAPDRYLNFLQRVAERQAALVAQWMHVGFIHGVMNTDNMSLAGETIDYGPCAFMDAYDPGTVFSSIDDMGRYAYDQQARIARWNLARFAETLLPLLADDEQQAIELATGVIDAFPARYQHHWLEGARAKLGLRGQIDDGERIDTALAQDWLTLLQAKKVDFTLAWRRLADAAAGDEGPLRALFTEHQTLDDWLARWQARCAAEADSPGPRAEHMRRVNPWLIPRNHRVEEALDAATQAGDLAPFEQLLEALRLPFEERPAFARYAEPAPADFTQAFRTFCGT
ncbi:YdiU family protein [Azoarcus sp. L1K30]|uniref:protein adenylyltransferase SelO n=1 Tax=Azoarcus sp. L1K30 TaxID=2820277 RepID=UPI001B842BCC|nr:YdiU family protein [Azoarcus sp. L1K30]MBR0565447.1 YdiU family protein [Azoarcus sp. L1K30]